MAEKRLARSGKRGKGPPPKRKTREEIMLSRMPDRYAMFITGEYPISDLTMEELERGQLMDLNGGFSGAPPTMLPLKFYHAMRDEYQRRLELEMRPLMRKAYEGLEAVVSGPGQAGVARVNAAKELLDRLGNPVGQKVEVTHSVDRPLWEQVLDVDVDLTTPDKPAELENVVDAEIVTEPEVDL